MGDILPPKKQAIVERLRRRIEDYRHHHGGCLPRYERTTNGINDQYRQGTLLLQQRYLEPKTKKANKKSEHKKDNLQNLGQKLLKRPAESPLDIGESGFEDSDHHPSKILRTNNNNNNGNQNLTQFHVEIVQQFTSSGSSQAQQIQTNVTVKTLAGNVKSDSMLVSNSNGNNGTSKLSDQSPASGLGQVECKQEPELDSLDDCLLGGDGANNGASHLPDSLSNFGFIEDSSDEIMNPDTLKDLIAELTPDLSHDLMSDFNFDKFDDSNIETTKVPESTDKNLSNSGNMMDMGKPMGNVSSQTQLQSSNQPPSFPSTPNPSSPLYEGVPGGTGGMNSLGSMPPVSTSVVAPPAARLPNYSSLGAGLGLDFNLKEPSPAAQTLKQMAEQHQNMQQKHQQFGLGMNSPHPRSPFDRDFGLPGSNQYNNSSSSGTQDFLNSSSSNNPTYLTKGSNQGMFPFGQGNLGSGIGNPSLMKQEPSSLYPTGQPTLMKQEPSSLYSTGQPPSSMNPMSELEMRKRQQQVMQMQRISVDQKPNLGTPGTAGPGSSAASNAPPLGFGTTKPLSHFTEPVSTSASSASNQSNMPQLQAPFIRGPAAGSQFPNSARTPVRPNLQITQNQQMQISQNNQQLQVSQGQHIHLQEMAAVTQAQQQQQGLFGFPPSSSEQFQLSVSQSQSVSFTASSAQYPGRTAQGPMNVGSAPMMTNAQFDKLDPLLRQKMFQQQMMRQQMEKQKMAQLQQRHPQQQQTSTSNPPTQMPFMNRPPPEYKPQQTPPISSPGLPPLAAPNNIMSAKLEYPNQGFSQVNSHHPPPGGNNGCNSSSPLNELTMNQSTNLQPGQNRMLGPNGQSMQSQTMSSQMGNNMPGLGSAGPRFGGPPSAQPGSMVLGGQGLGNARMSMNPNTKGMPFGSPLMRGHRPPNVNVGPDGLNIGQRGPPGHDWRHMMIQNQRFSAAGGKSAAGNPMSLQARIPFTNANSMAAATAGFNSMQSATSAGSLQMTSMQQQQQVRLAMAGINRTNPPSNQIPNHSAQGMGVIPSSASSMGIPRPSGPNGNPSGGNQTNLSMQMSSSVNIPANLGNQNNFMQSNSGVPSDFNLDFLDNIGPGMDGNASAGFSSSDATELLNTFDSVMQNNSASYMLDGGL